MVFAQRKPSPPPPTSIRAADILSHLGETIAWYRHIDSGLELSGVPTDILIRQRIHQTSLRALQLAFDFARAEASLLAASGGTGAVPANAGATTRNMELAAQRALDRINNIQARINEVNAALAKPRVNNVSTLESQRRELNSQLNLAKEVQKTIQGVISFTGGAASGVTGGLAGQINDLERSVPEASPGSTRADCKSLHRSRQSRACLAESAVRSCLSRRICRRHKPRR